MSKGEEPIHFKIRLKELKKEKWGGGGGWGCSLVAALDGRVLKHSSTRSSLADQPTYNPLPRAQNVKQPNPPVQTPSSTTLHQRHQPSQRRNMHHRRPHPIPAPPLLDTSPHLVLIHRPLLPTLRQQHVIHREDFHKRIRPDAPRRHRAEHVQPKARMRAALPERDEREAARDDVDQRRADLAADVPVEEPLLGLGARVVREEGGREGEVVGGVMVAWRRREALEVFNGGWGRE